MGHHSNEFAPVHDRYKGRLKTVTSLVSFLRGAVDEGAMEAF